VRTTAGSSAPREAGPSIRRAGPDDLAGVVALWIALTRDHARREPLFALAPGAEAQIRGLIAAQLRDPDTALFVAETGRDEAADAGPASGPIGLCIVRVDRVPPIHAETRRAEITDLFVNERRRRSGVGGALVDHAFEWARRRGAPRIEVRVESGNDAGRAFWRARGFGHFMDVLHRRL
jgi:ribosomal protein S18 acetylase RimI-like enzyme